MGDGETTAEEDDSRIALQTKLQSVNNRVANTNQEVGDAISRSGDLLVTPTPEYTLRQVHTELIDAYYELTEAIDMVERTINDVSDESHPDPTPKQIVTDHAERFEEIYDGPVLWLAMELLQANRRKWLHRNPETEGARSIERHGLTKNQRKWLNDLQEAWEESHEEDTSDA